jgi:predicted Zn-dependent peptidase
MSRVAKNEVYFKRDFPLAEVAARIDATSNDEIVHLAERLVRPDSMAVALLGNLDGRRVDESILAA